MLKDPKAICNPYILYPLNTDENVFDIILRRDDPELFKVIYQVHWYRHLLKTIHNEVRERFKGKLTVVNTAES